jgi:amino acid transporter
MWRKFQRVKAITTSTRRTSFDQNLSLFDLLCYGVGCSVGAGVYSLVGVGAAITGPSISFSFFLAGIACIFTSLTYSEFAARVPVRCCLFFK